MMRARSTDTSLMVAFLKHRRLLAACGVVLSLATPIAARAESPLSDSGTAHQGALILHRVQHAYVHVRGVITAVRGGGVDAQFTEVLRRGVVVSEGYVGRDSAGTTKLVASNGAATYAKEPGTGCWRRLARSSPQTLTDIGHPLLYMPGASIVESRATAGGWVLRLSQNGTTAVITVSKRFLVRSIAVTHGGQRASELFTTLARTPKLPDPRPRCG